jgi:hypothetical protein
VLPELRLFDELVTKVRARSGASPAYAADLRACLLEAGFQRTEARAEILTVAGGSEDFPVFRQIRENQVREPTFWNTVIEQGWATDAQLEDMLAGIARVSRRNDLFGFVVFVAALAWV